MKTKQKQFPKILALLMIGLVVSVMYGCSSGSGDGTTTTPLGSVDIPVTLSGDFSVSALTPNPAAAGSGTLTLNRDTGALSGSMTTSGLSSTTVNAHIHTGLAGIAGGVVVALDFTTTANTVSVIPGTVLDAAQMTELLNANYYINVHTANNSAGELRGQILPANFQVIRTLLDGASVTVPTGSTNTGISFLTINTDTLSVRGNITNSGLDNADLAHIHGPALAGANAGPIVTYIKDSTNPALWEFPDDTVVSQTIMDYILTGQAYINVHSTLNGFPGGEIRGQIGSPTLLGSVNIPVTLSGDFSVSALTPNPAAAGTGTLTLNRDTGALSGSITTSGLSSATVNAHIHTGLAGIAGGVVVALDFATANTVSVIPGTVLSSAQMTELLNANYYINVHTTNNTGGELRGQILPANFQVIRTLLDGASVTVPTGSTNTGIGFLTINPVTLSVRGNITNTGLDNADLAHIHGPALAGANAGAIVTYIKDSTNSALWEFPDDTVVSQTIMDYILTGQAYINVHSTLNGFPGGEIRGQIAP